jgi:hypothetical protein
MTLVRITNVTVHELPLDQLHGAHLELPQEGTSSNVYGFDIEGWVVSKTASVAHVEVLLDGRPILKFQLLFARRDVASSVPEAAAGKSGFRASLSALSLPASFQVVLRVTLESGIRIPIARIAGEREPLPASQEARIQPLMMNTIGRSGSTWLGWLLGCHPEILAYEPFAQDARVSTYWMSVLQDLSQPKSYREQFGPKNMVSSHWWLGDDESAAGEVGENLESWLGGAGVESVARFCQGQIEGFYTDLAASTGKPRAQHFVEKVLPYQMLPDLLSELYPGAREIILVRDFRDLLSSVLAFNEKRGYQAFGREQRDSDSDYVKSTLRRSAEALLRRWRRRAKAAQLVRYEDLVLDPQSTLRRLLGYLDLDASDEVVRQTIERAQNASGAEQHQTVSDPAASIGRWRRDLPAELQAVCKQELDGVLAEFGYEPTTDPVAERV